MIKNLSEIGTKENFLNLEKNYKKSAVDVKSARECFSAIIGNKARIFILTISIQHHIGRPSWFNKARGKLSDTLLSAHGAERKI